MTSATPKPRAGEHTAAPWCLGPDGGLWSKDGPLRVDDDPVNARRIMACVNCLEGISTAEVERMSVAGHFATIAALEAERDLLRERETRLLHMMRKSGAFTENDIQAALAKHGR